MPAQTTDERLTSIESLFMHFQQDFDSLNREVIAQQKQIHQLTERLERVEKLLAQIIEHFGSSEESSE